MMNIARLVFPGFWFGKTPEEEANPYEDNNVITDEKDIPFKDRIVYVNLKDKSAIAPQDLYGVDYMHSCSNSALSINEFLLQEKYDKDKSLIYKSLHYFYSNKDYDEFFDYLYKPPSYIKDVAAKFFTDYGEIGWINEKNLLNMSNFKCLTSHKKMLWLFHIMPLCILSLN